MDEQRRVVVLVRPRTVLVVVGLSMAAVLLLLFVFATRRVLIWLLIALFLALALDQVVSILTRWIPRTQAALVTFGAALLAVAGVGYLLVPPLVEQVSEFVVAVPDLVDQLARGRGPLGFLEREFGIVERAREYVDERGAGGAFGLTQPLISTLGTLLTGLIAAVSITFLTLFLLIYGPAWKRGLIDLTPPDHQRHWEAMADGIRGAVGGWVIGAVVIAVAAGTSSSLVLFALGVPYAIALGLVVGLLDPIPFVGATAGAVIVALAAWATEGLVAALIFVAFVLLYQQVIENNLLVPFVYGRTVQLTPLAVLVAVVLGGELAGIVGALAAVPIAGSLKVVASELLAWKREREIEPLLPTEPAPAPQPLEPLGDRPT